MTTLVHALYEAWWVAGLCLFIPWWFRGYNGADAPLRLERVLMVLLLATGMLTFWFAELMQADRLVPGMVNAWPVVIARATGIVAMLWATRSVTWLGGWYWLAASVTVVAWAVAQVALP